MLDSVHNCQLSIVNCQLKNIFSLAVLQIPPDRAHVAQGLHNFGYDLEDVVDLLVGVILAEGKPQAAVGHIVDPADGQQHMAGIQAAAGAGRAGGRGYALHIQQKQQRFALDAFKTEADIVGQTAIYSVNELSLRGGRKPTWQSASLAMSLFKNAPEGVRIATPVCALVRNDISCEI